MSATLKNKSRHTVVIVLDHQAFANKESGWNRTTASFATQTAEGNRVVQEVRRAYPGSLTILPGEVVKDLHDAIVNCSQVPELISRGVLQVTHSDDEKSATAPSTSESAPVSAPRVKVAKEQPVVKD